MWPCSSAYRAVYSTVFVNTVTSGAILHREDVRGRTNNTPAWEEKIKTPSQSPVWAPCCSPMEFRTLQLNSPWRPHQFVVSAGIVAVLPALVITSSSSWCRQRRRVSDLSGQGWAERERKRPRAEQLGRSACPPPRDPQETPQLQPLHCTVKGSHQPPGGSLKGAAPSVTLPQPNLRKQRNKGEQSRFTISVDPLQHFTEFHEFHGEHFILMVSTDIWVLLHVTEVQGCRWGRCCFSLVGSHPVWLQRHLLWPCCSMWPLFTNSETQNNTF